MPQRERGIELRVHKRRAFATWIRARRLRQFAAASAVIFLGSITCAAQAPDTLLDQAAVALDGSTSVVDRLGNPKLALDLADRAISAARLSADRRQLARALAYKVRAAGAAGMYDVGRQAALEALQLPLTDASRSEVAGSVEWFRFLIDAQQPFARLYDDEVRLRQPRMPEIERFSFAPLRGEDVSPIDPSALTRLLTANATLILSRSAGDETTTGFLERFRPAVRPSCAAGPPCAWDGVFAGELLYAAGRADAAAASWSDTAKDLEAAGDRVMAAIIRMKEGDAWAAPMSSPLELNLMTFNPLPSTLALNAGLAVPELQTVDAQRLTVARARYAQARRLLPPNRCPRCEVDLTTREAYLAFASGNATEAGRLFETAWHEYGRLGDAVYAAHTAAAAAGALMIGADSTGARAVIDALLSELEASRFAGGAIGTARLLARIAFRLRQRGSVRDGEEALDLALVVTARFGLTQIEGELLGQKADLLIAVGRRHEGLLLKRRARLARETYMAAVPTFTFFQATNGVDGELASVRQELLAAAYEEEAAFFAEGDVVHARESNELMKSVLRQGTAPFPMLDRDVTDENEVLLLLAQDRIADALTIGRNVSDPLVLATVHLYARRFEEVVAIATRETEKAIASLPQGLPAGALANLQLQQLRSRIQRGIDLLISAHAAADAQALLERLASRWPREGRDAREWLYEDTRRPWVRDVAEAGLAEELGKLQDAERLLANARAAIARVAASIGDLHAREGFDSDASFVDRSYVRVLIAEGRAADGLLALEASRARVYHQQLATADVLAGNSQSENSLRAWWAAEANLREFRLRALAGDRVEAADLTRLENQTDALRAAVTREIPSASMLVSDSRVDTALLDALKAKLRASVSTVLIAYFVTGGDVYAWVIRSEGIVLRKLPIEARELADRTAAMYNRLATPQANWQAPARQLYSALLEPLEDLLPRTVSGASRPRIGILPHATVNLVPFAALVDGQSRVLVQRFDIFYSPSLRTYLRSSQPLDRRAVVEAFGFNGDVLSHAEKEAEAVTTAGHVRVGAAVTRAAVLHAAATSDIVHLATHATQDSANPFGARLYVSDGALTLSDLLGVTWRTRLVTLSACDTAAGRVTTADEFTGISRGLLAAGVPQVLVTAWRVDDDSTAAFMKRFYEALSTAHDAVSALGDAQRATVTGTGDAAHPGFWAPFVIVGADR